MTKEQLADILHKHKRWLTGKTGGIKANLAGADLRDADLRNVDLRHADLRDADLRDADLRDANLRDANLVRAKLWCTRLGGADLRGANLTGIDFSGINLEDTILWGNDIRHCIGNGYQIKSMQVDKWPITYTKDQLAIGCQQHTIEEWRQFTDIRINYMSGNVLDRWTKNKEWLFETLTRFPAL